jgi:hypothetical protein
MVTQSPQTTQSFEPFRNCNVLQIQKIHFMRKLIPLLSLIVSANTAFGQASGNINYLQQTTFRENNIDVRVNSNDIIINVKGMTNVKTESYVAIFSVTQTGENLEEIHRLIEERINQIKKPFELKKEIEFYTDMISFVPCYEFEETKKAFNKKTYNEVPKGFEMKVTLHVKYKKPNSLSEIVAACSSSEVYELIRVDYFASNIEQVKKELTLKAQTLLKEKIKMRQDLLGKDFTPYKKQLAEGYKIVYPLEMYKSYQAYSSSSLNLKKSAAVTQTEKSTTLFYQPVFDKEFDFVTNPEIFEPAIQVMYEITFVIYEEKEKVDAQPNTKPAETKPTKEYFIITHEGNLKPLDGIK